MHKLSLLIGGTLLSQALAFGAFAQEPGVGTPTPPAYKKTAADDRAAGKAQRREEGRAAAKEGSTTGEGVRHPDAQAKVPREQRQEARAARKAETVRAAKAGELQASGEVGPQK